MRLRSREGSVLRSKDKAFRRLLSELSEGDAAIVVEGKRDRDALRRMGITNQIFLINQKPDIVAERVAKTAHTAIVLTDFDRKGEELCLRITSALEGCSVKPDLDVRRKLKYLFGVRFFEELDRKVEEFQEKLEEIER